MVLVLTFFILILPYISPRYRGLLNNFITPILPGMGKALYSDSKLEDENDDLRRKVQKLEAKQDYWDSLYDENNRLRKMQEMKPATDFDVVVANITIKDSLTGKYRFIIDRGSKDGLRLGMPVMTGRYLLGRIVEIRPDDAVVGTLAMRNVNVYCRIKGTEFPGKMDGEAKQSKKGKLFCKLTRLPRDVELKVGMVVQTSGFASDIEVKTSGVGMIPKGLEIGIIREVSKNEKFQEAVVELSADWDSAELVTILKKLSK
jgi:rod shape-determining protein MreC